MKCSMPGCDRKSHYRAAGLCKACYAYMYYWQGRSVTDIMQRSKQIELWQTRLKTCRVRGRARRAG